MRTSGPLIGRAGVSNNESHRGTARPHSVWGARMKNRLEIENLSKTFSGTQVLCGISFDLRPGEIHALVGENGCGKSTFIKCLAGFHEPDPGAEITLDGQRLQLPLDPTSSLEHGFSFIHQDLGLVPTLTVKENIALSRGFKTGMGWRIDWDAERHLANEALATFGADINPDARISDISKADRTIVAIARAFARSGQQGKVLALDEPTAALPAADVDRLFEALRRIAAKGVGMIYVSHRLQEILKLADRVTAFRDGFKISTQSITDMDESGLIQMIVGRSLEKFYPEVVDRPTSEPLLEVRNLKGHNNENTSFSVGKGEIVGLAGLLGSGRSEIARMLFGIQQPDEGEIRLEGKDGRVSSPREALKLGMVLVPEDRLNQGGFSQMNVAENMSLPDLSEFWNNGVLNVRKERQTMQALTDVYNIRPRDVDIRFHKLSGGNQQKAIIARTLRLKPKLLILDEPVQGVDIGAKLEIYEFIKADADQGTGIILIDSDFEDLARLCHRVLVLRDGHIVAELAGEELTRSRILQLVFGFGEQSKLETATA